MGRPKGSKNKKTLARQNEPNKASIEVAGHATGVIVAPMPKQSRRTVKDELGPVTKKVKDSKENPAVIISWRDNRGRARTTEYMMAELSINESVSEEFHGAKKQTRIHLTIDGMVQEKN